MSLRIWWVVGVLGGFLTLTEPAAAQSLCRLTGSASSYALGCLPERTSCARDADCLVGMDVHEPICRMPIGLCGPRCGTLAQCESPDDCVVGGIPGDCVSVATSVGPLAGTSFCEPPSGVFCQPPGDSVVDERQFIACHTFPHSDTIAPSWGDGDCDQDGCPNGNDRAPCDSADVDCTFPLPFADLVCETRRAGIGPEVCVVAPGPELSCGVRHPCGTAADCANHFVCTGGFCAPPVCSTLYACRQDSDCPQAAERGVPDLGPGRCLRGSELFGPSPSPDGFCSFDAFRATGCDMSDIRNCLSNARGATADFFAGDCDLDGCPNGIDAAVCDDAITGPCEPAPSLACPGTTLMRMEQPDAGENEDVGEDRDAGDGDASAFDGGAFDAPASGQISFAGGSGCRCGVGAAEPRGALTVFAGLAIVLLARRRR